MKRMQILVTDEQYEALRVIAFTERRSLADVIREAVEKYLKEAERDVDPISRAARPGKAGSTR